MAAEKKKISGTREWAVANIDCCTGCSHGCKYCYARYDSVIKRKQVSESEWSVPQIRRQDVDRKFPPFDGPVMFPTSHDILPEILDDCLTVIANLLRSGNRVLIVTKPHLECVQAICTAFSGRRNQILFRFTITAADDSILQFWEPEAPNFNQRMQALKYAHSHLFETSISIEPMLDSYNITGLVEVLKPFVSHSIWLGKMNKIDRRVTIDSKEMEKEIIRIEASQCDARIQEIYNALKDNPLVRWKESIKQVVGLELADEPGLDI